MDPAQSNTDGLVMTGDLLRVLVVLVVLCLAGRYLMYDAVLARYIFDDLQ